ncbi:MAG: sigma-70 family RNA polymerase sigma factor [Deltaproteobacteria bacterium]|nr:sigma-70 family RNA polymerase sigma factor [Deltaproteobacteria bacterium]
MSVRERLLIRRLRERDERAFREMVDEYSDRVFGLTLRMLGNREEAEDVAQEVFITVFKSIDSFRGDSKFSTWLYRIAANHCKNRIKYLARRHDRKKSEFDEEYTKGAMTGAASTPKRARRPDEQVHSSQMEVLIQQAIESLKEEHRLLIILSDVEELSMKEICDITGLAEGTVKSRIHRARKILQKKLAKYMDQK